VSNGEHFLQINGTVMGTKMAPSYANIFMGRLERNLLMQAPVKPLGWLRFIDDIEMKWAESRKDLDNFIELANGFHTSIKFTVEISRVGRLKPPPVLTGYNRPGQYSPSGQYWSILVN
jgi:hypothetical protein